MQSILSVFNLINSILRTSSFVSKIEGILIVIGLYLILKLFNANKKRAQQVDECFKNINNQIEECVKKTDLQVAYEKLHDKMDDVKELLQDKILTIGGEVDKIDNRVYNLKKKE